MTKRSDHTPGPWKVGPGNPETCRIPVYVGDYVGDPGGDWREEAVAEVAYADGSLPGNHGEANARLIAEAPETKRQRDALLEAAENGLATLETLLLHVAMARTVREKIAAELRSAIAQARVQRGAQHG